MKRKQPKYAKDVVGTNGYGHTTINHHTFEHGGGGLCAKCGHTVAHPIHDTKRGGK